MRSRFLIPLLAAGVALALFAPVRHYEFVNWDDNVHIYENPHLRSVTLESVGGLWVAPYRPVAIGKPEGFLYAPVSFSVWAALAAFSRAVLPDPADPGALDPGVFHAANVLVHVASVLLVFSLLRLLLLAFDRREGREPQASGWKVDAAAGAGSLLFAIHPVQVEPVAWATGMKDLLCGCFSLVALRQYALFTAASTPPLAAGVGLRRRAWLYASASAGLLLAVLAKPVAVVVPVLALVGDRLAFGRSLAYSARSLGPWFAVSAAFAVLAKAGAPGDQAPFPVEYWERIFVAGDALGFYVAKLVLPVSLGIDYGRTPAAVLGHWWGYLTWTVPAAIAVLVLSRRDRNPWLAAFLLFAVALIPVLGLVPFRHQHLSTVADRYLYLPMLGAALAAAFAFHRGGVRTKLGVLLALTLLGARAAVQLPAWESSTTMYTSASRTNPRSVVAHFNLALTLERAGETEAARGRLRRVVELDPDHKRALYNLGAMLLRMGRPEEAIDYLERAIAVDPEFIEAIVNAGTAYLMQRDYPQAIRHYTRALEIAPGSGSARRNLKQARRLEARGVRGSSEEAVRPGSAGVRRAELP